MEIGCLVVILSTGFCRIKKCLYRFFIVTCILQIVYSAVSWTNISHRIACVFERVVPRTSSAASASKIVIQPDIHKLCNDFLLVRRGTCHVGSPEDKAILDSPAIGCLEPPKVSAIIGIIGINCVTDLNHPPTAFGIEGAFEQVVTIAIVNDRAIIGLARNQVVHVKGFATF